MVFSTHTGSYISSFAKNTIEATIVWYTNMAAFFLCVMTSQISVCTAIVTYTEEVFGPATSIFFSICHKATVSLYTNMAAVFLFFILKRWWHHMKRLYIHTKFLKSWAPQYLPGITICDYPNLAKIWSLPNDQVAKQLVTLWHYYTVLFRVPGVERSDIDLRWPPGARFRTENQWSSTIFSCAHWLETTLVYFQFQLLSHNTPWIF